MKKDLLTRANSWESFRPYKRNIPALSEKVRALVCFSQLSCWKYPSFIREGARACVFFTAFLLGSLSSLFFDMSPYWGWLLWLIAAFVSHVICEQLYRRHVFAWYEANLRFANLRFEDED
jgi:hypothetical protein